MTGPQTITTDHLRALLDSQDPASVIALLEGEVAVIESSERDSEQNLGALDVISRGELDDRLSAEATEDELRALAEALTTTMDQIGG